MQSQEQLWAGFTDLQWKLRILGDDFTFTRGLCIRGVGDVDHPLMIELMAQSPPEKWYHNKRPRVLHLFHCTEVPQAMKDRAIAHRFFQGPVPTPVQRHRPWTPGTPPAGGLWEAPDDV